MHRHCSHVTILLSDVLHFSTSSLVGDHNWFYNVKKSTSTVYVALQQFNHNGLYVRAYAPSTWYCVSAA
jgi:hypothetical protein